MITEENRMYMQDTGNWADSNGGQWKFLIAFFSQWDIESTVNGRQQRFIE